MEQLLAYWRLLLKDDVLSDWRDLDPMQIPKLLPGIILIDIHHDHYRFRFRLIGEPMVAY